MSSKWNISFTALVLIPCILWSQDDATIDSWLYDDTIELEVRDWERDINLRVSTGYSDNVLLASIFEQGSAFIGAEVELFTWRKPKKDKANMHFYLDAQQIHYFDVEGIDNEYLIVSQGQLSKRLNDRMTVGGSLQANYIDQVYDISASSFELDTTTLKVGEIKFTPFFKIKNPNGYFSGVDFDLRRDFFEDTTFDFTEPSIEFHAGKRFKHGSIIRFNYAFAHRFFDTRVKRDTNGFPLPGTILEWNGHTVDVRWLQFLNKDKTFHIQSKWGVKWNSDNGTGYYDYSLYKISESFMFEKNKWEIAGEIAYKYYDYDIQTVSFDNLEGRYLSQTNILMKVERKINDKWEMFLEYNRERSRSNRLEDEYSANRVILGFDYLF